MELTNKEKDAIANLKRNFNVVHYSRDLTELANARSDISRSTAFKLFKASILLNCLTILLYLGGYYLAISEPEIAFYASTENGTVYGPLKKMKKD